MVGIVEQGRISLQRTLQKQVSDNYSSPENARNPFKRRGSVPCYVWYWHLFFTSGCKKLPGAENNLILFGTVFLTLSFLVDYCAFCALAL